MGEIDLEKYSSAFTLSDMEIFVFPELMYSLLLANIMSPIVWTWRDEESFKKLDGKDPYKKLMRLRQFIMDEFEFNLDLQTWGLTNKNTEIKRFEKYLPAGEIAKSNALFGYEGDTYYYDVDIRKHFGLDKYNGDIIPYWKTETVEAMNAFRLKEGYKTGAGECVSLSTLYAAAAFIVCGIPLEDIYMVLTPLHSQNFIDINDGVITNNRRLVTKTMWFNGTELSNKAQRALRNEQITIVAHTSGLVHCLYSDAAIDKNIYDSFCGKLSNFLRAELSTATMVNFLRANPDYQKYFQFCRDCRGNPQFVKAEDLFNYEHLSPLRVADCSHKKMLDEVFDGEFSNEPFPNRIQCEQFAEFMKEKKPDIATEQGRKDMAGLLADYMPHPEKLVNELYDFLHIEPKLPTHSTGSWQVGEKNYKPSEPIKISTEMSREEIIDYLSKLRKTNAIADLAFYAYRDMSSCDWKPFIKSAIERSPVSIEMAKQKSIEQCFQWLQSMPNESIYDSQRFGSTGSPRVAQPDEVANYKTGDGIEKAIALANIIHWREAQREITIGIDKNKVIVEAEGNFEFESSKQFKKNIVISGGEYRIEAGK
ncbi:MAG: hypothetical protein WCE45_06755 [Sedimentisphaerales bacterium]